VIAWCRRPAIEKRWWLPWPPKRRHPVDLALDLALASKLEARFRMSVFNDNEDEVAELWPSPRRCSRCRRRRSREPAWTPASRRICSAGGARARDVRDPRRRADAHVAAADVFGITGCGRSRSSAADVVVFDPKTVGASSLRGFTNLPAGGDRLTADGVRHRGGDRQRSDDPPWSVDVIRPMVNSSRSRVRGGA